MFTRTTFVARLKVKKATQYIKNNVCRRQDLPEALLDIIIIMLSELMN